MNVCFDASEFELSRLGWHFPLAILVLRGGESVAKSSLGLSRIGLGHNHIVVGTEIGNRIVKFVSKLLGRVLVLGATCAAADWITL
jgi:hypothetical protein